MLIESLAQKTRLAMITVLATIGGCAVICGFTVWCCISLVNKERDQIYILDGNIPFLAERAQLEANFTMEAKAHIQLFHQYFLQPAARQRLHQVDARQGHVHGGRHGLEAETGDGRERLLFRLISSSAVCTVMCDSIDFDEQERKFTYYGTQLIKRRTRDLKRSLVTTGYVESVPRTRNNPHGLLITNWRTLENKDLDY